MSKPLTLYSQGILGLGKTAQLAGLSRLDVNRVLADRHVPMHYGPEELAEDLQYAVVVSDASPLICFSALGRFDLLNRLFDGILVPTVVWQEITRIPAFSAGSPQAAANAQTAGWLRVATARNRPLVVQLETVLDSGEAEAIALAVERKLVEAGEAP